MLTGDSEAVAEAVAEELGIDQYFAEVLPEHKDQKVAELQAPGQARGHGRRWRQRRARPDPRRCRHRHRQRHRCGHRVGRHHPGQEQPAGRGQDHRAEPGQLSQDDPEPAVGDRLQRRRPAAGGRRPGPSFGILLSPAVGAVFMSLSTIIVAINAQTLRRAKLGTAA